MRGHRIATGEIAEGGPPRTESSAWVAVDRALCILFALATVLYLAAWPHDLFPADEGTFLYEAKRILDGEVIYRDFFEVITPASLYAMAFLFRLFGASMDTARLGMAAVHALIVVTMYATCRRLGVRRSLAAATGLAHVALCYPALPISSPHWVATLLTLIILLMAVPRRSSHARLHAAAIGVVTGLLIAVQQQKGTVIALGTGLILLFDSFFLNRRSRVHSPTTSPLLFLGGMVAVVVPMLIALLAAAGWKPVFDALIRHPFVYYTAYNRTTWGSYARYMPQYQVFPELIRYLPAIISATLLRLVWISARGSDHERTRQLIALGLIGLSSIGAIWYFPDYIRLAVVTPVFLILTAETLEAALRRAEQIFPFFNRIALVIACLLCLALPLQAERNRQLRQQLYPHSHLTAFGRVDFRNPIEISLVDTIQGLLKEGAARDLFCYTSCPGLYLTTGTDNPTPYQLMIPGYNRPDQLAEVVHTLEARKVNLVVAIRVAIKQRDIDDPIWTYLVTHYEPVPIWPKPQFAYGLFRRKDATK